MSNHLRRAMMPAIVLLAIAASAAGLANQFAYDDRYIVQLNNPIHTLHGWWGAFTTSYWPKDWGGDGYRPLTMLAYRIEWAIGHGSPIAFHAANILLYALCAGLLFALARRLLEPRVAWIVAALFAVDPVHVEAVANVVGQSELIVGAAVLAATLLYVRARQAGALGPRTAAAVLGLYLVACFGKEHGVVLPAILGAAELLLIDDAAGMRQRILRLRPFYLMLVAVAVFFLGVRSLVLGGHDGIGGFQPFTPFSSLHISTADRILTALAVVPQWIRLLLWPAHLSAEYGPPGIPIAQGFEFWQLPGMILLAAVLALGVALHRRRPVISFGIAVICVALLPSSNFILPAGIVLAERTLFLPSVGAALVVGGALSWIAAVLRERWNAGGERPRWLPALAAVAATGLIVVGAVRSELRTTVWKDNERLFSQTVIDSPLSYRAHFMYGAWLFDTKRKRLGEEEYHKALAMFPYDAGLSYNMAQQYVKVGLCAPAIPLFRWTLALDPKFPEGHTAFAACLLEEGHYAEAKAQALSVTRWGLALPILRHLIHAADSAQAADTLGKRSVAHSVVQAGHTGRSPDTMQKAAEPGPRGLAHAPPKL